jgi:hypothetical protein
MLQRNLLYTGVTRGKQLVVLVGQKKAVALRCVTSRAGGDGRSWQNGCALVPSPLGELARQVEPRAAGERIVRFIFQLIQRIVVLFDCRRESLAALELQAPT